jgi:hypothetical protein
MTMGKIRSAVDVEDFLRGTNFLSASGGGDPALEREHLLQDVEDGLEIGWVPLDSFADDDMLFCVCYSGSIAPESFDDPEQRALKLGGGQVLRRPFIAAIGLLERHLGVSAAGLISVEIGGINGGAILSAAARRGLPLADADYAGRAIPELHATALDIHGTRVLPFACADRFGNEIVIVASPSNAWTERLSKYLALGSLGIIACAFAALPASAVREIAIPGTMSESLHLGAAIREAREAGDDPVAAAAGALDGWVLFRGTVTGREWENTGYMDGRHTLTGLGDFEGHELAVWFRNENHVSWLDGEPWVASPDLIEFCDPQTAEPLVNTYLELGQEIAVVGRRRRDAFDSEAGLRTLGPQHFGFDVPFQGIERLVAR